MRRKKRYGRRLLGLLLFLGLLIAAALLLNGALRARERRRFALEGMPIPPLYQYDYKDVVCTIEGRRKSVSSSGCGAVCMSMAIAYLTGDTAQTPQTLFEEAYAAGDYNGNGLTHAALDRMARAHGVEGEWLGKDAAALRRALESGRPVIAHMGPGAFTGSGHYILLRGITADGQVFVNDPNSESRTWETWELQGIIDEAKGGVPFMACRRRGFGL